MQQATRLISLEGLVRVSRNGRASPRLAERWTNSPDGLTWTIQLRANALFHDGTPVDSAAVKQSLERSLASVDRDLSPGLADISVIEAPTPLQILIHLRNRSTFLLDDLTVAITKARPGGAIGTGPYITASSSDGQIVMDAFTRYYRGNPVISRVVWKPYPTVRTAWAAMMRGDVDFLYDVGPDTREFIEGENSTRIFSFLRNYAYVVAFNLRRPGFQDSRIRNAMNYAIDRSGIVQQAFKGHAKETSTPAWPEHWAYDPEAPAYNYDPSRAAALLDAALPRSGSTTTANRPPARFHFNCLLPENFALWERLGLLVQRNLAEVGIDMQLEAVPAEIFNERIGKSDFDAVLLELVVGNSVTRPFFSWYSESKQNFWGFKSPTVDRAFDGMRRASNEADYRNAFRDFQRQSVEQSPALFLVLGETTRAVNNRFQVVAPPGTDILQTIGDWRLADHTARMTN
jgi:peptide/nickel transport system substrate-binding protein